MGAHLLPSVHIISLPPPLTWVQAAVAHGVDERQQQLRKVLEAEERGVVLKTVREERE